MTDRDNDKQLLRDSVEQRLLSDSATTFHTMFEHSGTAKAVLDKNGIIVMANKALARLVDLNVREIEGKHSWFEFVAETDRRKAQEYHNLRRSHPGMAPERYEFILTDQNGGSHDIEINVAVFPKTDLSLLSMIEVTHLKTAQEMGRLTRFAVENAGTDDLTVLIEMHHAELDSYADLSAYGADVEGVTEFFPNRGPKVSISERLEETYGRA